MASTAKAISPRRPSYNDRIVIKRDRNGWEVEITDPEIVQYNDQRGDDDSWCDPCVEYNFETKEQVVAFVGQAMDIALPEDTFGSTFDKLAKEAMKS